MQTNTALDYIELGDELRRNRDFEGAIEAYKQALAIDSSLAIAYWHLGDIYSQQKNYPEALAHKQQALTLQPSLVSVEVHNQMAISFIEQGKYEEAITSWQRVILVQPNDIDAYYNLGTVFWQQRQLDESVKYYEKALGISPNHLSTLLNLAVVLTEQAKQTEAIANYYKIIEIYPDCRAAYHRLGIIFFQQNNLEDAIACLQNALEVADTAEQNSAEIYCDLAAALFQQNNLEDAIAYLQIALELNPHLAQAHWNLCTALSYTKNLAPAILQEAAETYYSFCSDLDPIRSRVSLIVVYMAAGIYSDRNQSLLHELESLLLNPTRPLSDTDIIDLYKRLLFALPHLRDRLFGENPLLEKIIGSIYTERILKPKYFTYPRITSLKSNQTDRHLKIGLISPNCRRHSVGWCARDIIRELSQFTPDLYLYITGDMQADDLTDIFTQSVTKVYTPQQYEQDTYANPTEIIEQIQQDHIDVLIDLDSLTVPMHTEILYAKPADVCISWLGFDAPFISEQNYYLSDRHTLPESVQSHYIEKIIRMPDALLAVNSLDCELIDRNEVRNRLGISSEQIVYLSMIPGRKLNLDTVTAQVNILKHMPNSILMYKGSGNIDMIKSIYQQQCEMHQVDFQRIKFIPFQSSEEKHRTNYLIADILLDSYPFNCVTHSMEALWFNLPVVTYVGQQFYSRISYSFLNTLDVTVGIAQNWTEYVEWGIKFGVDLELRNYLKQLLIQSKQPESLSPLWNPRKFAHDLYQTLQDLRYPS